MDVRRLFETLARRCRSALAGPVFRGAPGATLAIVGRDGVVRRWGPGASSPATGAGRAALFCDLFHADDRAAVAAAITGSAARRLTARPRQPDGGDSAIDLILGRCDDDSWTVLMLAREAPASPVREDARAAAVGAGVLADLSHEMRTPLNAVIGFAETIERETFGPIGHRNYAQYAGHIRMAGRHLLDLVNVVLDLSRVDADRYRLSPVLLDPGAVARECAGIMSQSAETAGLRLTLAIPDPLPACRLDPRALRQILLNLLSNAVKFTSDGEVRLSVSVEAQHILFVVKDDGVGMSRDALDQIGERFTGAHHPGVRGQGGSGLGLALAISLAELQGGAIDLSSAPGEGLRAEVRLPIGAAPARAKGLVSAAYEGEGSIPPSEEPLQLTALDRIKARRSNRAKAA